MILRIFPVSLFLSRQERRKSQRFLLGAVTREDEARRSLFFGYFPPLYWAATRRLDLYYSTLVQTDARTPREPPTDRQITEWWRKGTKSQKMYEEMPFLVHDPHFLLVFYGGGANKKNRWALLP